MAVSFNAVKPGDVLYDVHRYKANGGGSKQGCWEVHVLSIDYVEQTAIVRWNSNRPTKYRRRRIERLRRSKPESR